MALFKFARSMLSGKEIELYNNGEMKRSFTYVDDVVEGIIKLLAQPASGRDRIYNLGGAQAVTLSEFVTRIEKELGVTAKKKLAPLQAGDVPETIADCSLAERDFGYHPTVSIEEGIRRFAQWFREHKAFALSLEEPKQ
jgi:UDP-glucuronate 4-epimerase